MMFRNLCQQQIYFRNDFSKCCGKIGLHLFFQRGVEIVLVRSALGLGPGLGLGLDLFFRRGVETVLVRSALGSTASGT